MPEPHQNSDAQMKNSDVSNSFSLPSLGSQNSTVRLNQIDKIRACGVGDHISLPQIVVCGDQSAGKSSVLEGITGIPFPRQDGVCTKFATEIILRHEKTPMKINASIIPHSSAAEDVQKKLRTFRHDIDSLDQLPTIIRDAAVLMGLKGHGENSEGPAFASDVLRLQVVGETGLHLTIVDLPGLIAVANEEQTDDDIEAVSTLVNTYLESSRTIILAVVQASNDIAIQGIIRRSASFDEAGERTLGIITKPDLINEGTEGRIARLAKNQDSTKLRLGFFLLKNPSPSQLSKGLTAKERKIQEQVFFQAAEWKQHNLDSSRVGIDALRLYLQNLLDKHIEKELPKVRKEIEMMSAKVRRELLSLGEERPTTAEHRMFLTRLSMQFYNLTQSASIGNYDDEFSSFFDRKTLKGRRNRIRAQVHQRNTEFSTQMRDRSEKRKITVTKERVFFEGIEISENSVEMPAIDQLLVTEKEFKLWVKSVYQNTRGRELPGSYNHVLVSELFHEQSSRWHSIAVEHVDTIYRLVFEFVENALRHVVKEERVRQMLMDMADQSLRASLQCAREELSRLDKDEKRQPITYNHYFTDTIQKYRREKTDVFLKQALEQVQDEWGNLHVSNTPAEGSKLLAALQGHVVVDMDEQACSEVVSALRAYYKVSRKTFVDNVCRQVIERHLLANLPEIFSPTVVASYSDEELERIAAEQPENKEKRTELKWLRDNLEMSLKELRWS